MQDDKNIRFKKLRQFCKKNQEQWGEILGISKSGVSEIESGRRKVTEQHLIMLSNWKEYNINIDWIRTGHGDMLKPLLQEDKTAIIVSELLEKNNILYNLIIGAIDTFRKLDKESQTIILEFTKDVMNEYNKNKKSFMNERKNTYDDSK